MKSSESRTVKTVCEKNKPALFCHVGFRYDDITQLVGFYRSSNWTVHTNAQARGSVGNRQRTNKEANTFIVKDPALFSRIVNSSKKQSWTEITNVFNYVRDLSFTTNTILSLQPQHEFRF